ncbi:MAG: GNAT family N-acetyltransferase [Pseudomonadota bacterium]
MTKTLTIRPATREDVPTISIIAEQTDLFPPNMLTDMMDGYLRQTTNDIWFVGALEQDVIAFGFCEPERMTEGTWNLLAIGVLPKHQGQSHGAGMMRYLESRLQHESQRILLVETMGTPELALTRAFYLKNGYTEEARIREFYEAGADKVVFWKHL